MSFEDVSSQVAAGKTEDARKQITAKIENECSDKTKLRCDVVTLYRGAQHWVYRYQVYPTVKLVWAPEDSVGGYGGDTDNFVYPRYSLDAAIVRAYDATGKAVQSPTFFKIAKTPVVEGDVIFSIGNPGNTSRQMTYADATMHWQDIYPLRINSGDDLVSRYQAFAEKSNENRRRAESPLFGTQNFLKQTKGEMVRFDERRYWPRRRADEAQLRDETSALVKAGKLKLQRDPWKVIEETTAIEKAKLFESQAARGGWGTLLTAAFEIVEYHKETALPESQRLRGYGDSKLKRKRDQLTAFRPYYKDLEAVKLEAAMDVAMGLLGQEHRYVKALMGKVISGEQTAEQAATAWLAGTKLDDAKVRERLLSGSLAQLEASDDSLIRFALQTHALRRAVQAEDERLESVKERAYDDITRARQLIKKPGLYPDATGTLRLAAGKVLGYNRDGVETAWMTTYGGLFERSLVMKNHAAKDDFALPKVWWDSRNKLNPDTQLNFANTADIIGGSSGSPVLNVAGEIVGLQFDGNSEQTGNRFGYDSTKSRSVSVSMVAVVEALRKVYKADELLKELGQSSE